MADTPKPDTASEVASATFTEVRDAAQHQYDSVLVAIRRSPLQSVAIAAAIGFVVALIVR